MSILKQAQIDADNENMANNYRMLEEANKLQAAKQIGAKETLEGLAAMQAAQYATDPHPYSQMGAMQAMETQPSVDAAYARRLGVNNPYAGGTNFVPAELGAYKQSLAARGIPTGSLVDTPVQIVGDPRVAPTRFEDRSQFGKILEVLAQPYDPAADHGGM